jgi:hypothetical protein
MITHVHLDFSAISDLGSHPIPLESLEDDGNLMSVVFRAVNSGFSFDNIKSDPEINQPLLSRRPVLPYNIFLRD